MSEPKFTPGPWKVDGRAATRVTAMSERLSVASTGHDSEIPDAQQCANAHLIATAPEMYECLEGIAEFWRCFRGPPYHIERLETVLKKARGE